MASLLLSTKLAIPPVRLEHIARARLVGKLQGGLRGPLTLVSAPAGFGKTTLVAAGLREAGVPTAWVSLDAGDNDPVRFWSYVVAALEQIQPAVGQQALILLEQPRPAPIEQVLTVLINNLAAAPAEVALVLDDYHVIEIPAIHEALAFVVQHLPQQVHMVLTSRADPPLPIERLRARGQLVELRADELRFTEFETAAFLNDAMQLQLAPNEVERLGARTEGWAVGLQLAALALRNNSDPSGFVAAFTGSHRFVMDYLVADVLAQQPAHLQTFLLQTSILDRLCGPLCDAVLGIGGQGSGVRGQEHGRSKMEDRGSRMEHTPFSILDPPSSNRPDPRPLTPDSYSQVLLEQLERANVFTIALDDTRRWYRYHHLFADVLHERLHSGATGELVATLHRRAAIWFEQHELVPEAIQHWLATHDWEAVARLIEQHGRSIAMRGQIGTALGWLRALPDPVVQAHPLLCIHYAELLTLTQDLAGAEARLQDAERVDLTAMSSEHVRLIQGSLAAIRAPIVRFSGDYERSVALARQAIALLPESEALLRERVRSFAALAFLVTGDVTPPSEALSAELVDEARASGNMLTYVGALTNLGWIRLHQGRLHQAADLLAQEIDIAQAHGIGQTEMTMYCVLGLGDVLREQGLLERAEPLLRQAVDMATTTSAVDANALLLGSIALARLQQACQDGAAALTTLERCVELARRGRVDPAFGALAAAFHAQLQLAQGRLDAAVRWADSADLGVDDSISFPREQAYVALARVRVAQGRADRSAPHLIQAQRLLTRLLRATEAGARGGRVIEMLLLQALAFDAQGNPGAARNALDRALGLAEPEGYVRIFVDEGAPLVPLLQDAAARGVAPAYVARLLAAFGGNVATDNGAANRPSSTSPAPLPAPPLVEPLTERELDVLRLIATGLTNQQVAQQLTLSTFTVQSHVRAIFGKLGVNSRSAATRFAWQHRLVTAASDLPHDGD